MNKKLITIFTFSFALLFPEIIWGLQLIPTPSSNLNIYTTIYSIFNFIWPIFAGAALITFIWAGFLFLSAQGEPSKVDQAKKAVMWAIVGVAIALMSISIPFIIKNVLNV